MRSIAAEADGNIVSATAVGNGVLREVQLSQTADSILETLAIALGR